MKHKILASIVIVVVGITSMSSLMGNIMPSQLDTNLLSNQEETPPAPENQVPSALEETQDSISDIPIVESPVLDGDSVLQNPGEIVPGELLPGAMPADMFFAESGNGCGTCCCQPCCCTPCPVSTTFCIVDPCTGCSYEVCIDVPPCCVGNAPVVKWRGGIFGRRVVKLCWECCNKRAKVIITRHGKVRVRG